MIRTAAFASLFALALAAGTAQAYQPIGGGSATISGGGDDMQITYSLVGAGGGGGPIVQPGRQSPLRAAMATVRAGTTGRRRTATPAARHG